MLQKEFFIRPTLEVAKDLLGKRLICEGHEGYIVETEAYIGQNDPACHAARGYTNRTKVMFGPPGFSYVYFIYGRYYCLNIVTEREGFPAAVLIRGVVSISNQTAVYDGPGKLCRAWGITVAHNNIDMTAHDAFCVTAGVEVKGYVSSSRIGISRGKEKPWRFVARL